ncbi:GntR family transcriptional regulator [Tomitella gaofuii]|uniref:GntR family transcriptional regulator n=1 Tax=Tomitella gaofuii TaxID=2760083 RepID=UPI0015F987A7|nr:GntR family transcriptional regulator [Tomitella gaofuii]
MTGIGSITIDHDSPTAPFDQVRLQIIALVRDGGLIAGQKLPAVRELAQTLGIAANTAARSYRELEAAGVVETRGRRGTFIVGAGDVTRRSAELAAVEFVRTVRELGFDDAALRGFLESALD